MSKRSLSSLNPHAFLVAVVFLVAVASWWLMAGWALPVLMPTIAASAGLMTAITGLLAVAIASLLYVGIASAVPNIKNEMTAPGGNLEEIRRQRISQFNDVLATLIRAPGFAEGQSDFFLQHFTKTVSKAIDVSRVSVWRLRSGASDSAIQCLCLWDASKGDWDKGHLLESSTYPSYFEALLSDRTLVFDDVTADERVRELAKDYFPTYSITSMLDAPYHHDGKIGGVLCLEHTGPARKWLVEEQTFVISTSDILSLFFETLHRRELQNSLHRAEKLDALGKLTGGVAHDFNNMLGVIVGFADLLEHSLPKDSELSGYAREIVEAGQRGAKLTRNLLMFSKRQTTNSTTVNINEVLAGQQHMLEKTLTVRIRQRFELDDGLWPVNLDLSDLENAILNICINAMHAMNGEGELTFSTHNEHVAGAPADMLHLPDGDYVLLGLRDTGTGMDEELANKIFEPFFTTKGDRGSGLGLSQVYGFMQRCGGTIDVTSSPGNGALFTLYFPRYTENAEDNGQPEPTLDTPTMGRHENILVVDDEPALALMTAKILSSHGYLVHTANSAKEALQQLDEGLSVDVLLSDLVMPEMDGYQLAAKVRRRHPSIRIQLTSGYASVEPDNDTASDLRSSILSKPFTASGLLNRMRALLDDDLTDESHDRTAAS